MKKLFDNEEYIKRQSKYILERVEKYGSKLYLEFGGKLFDDYHASRVLPGYEPNNKMKLLFEMREKVEIIITINANDIEKNKIRNDIGISYSNEVLRLIDTFRELNLYVGSVVITQYTKQFKAEEFKKTLKNLGISVYLHYPIEGYPNNVEMIVSKKGLGKNEYIETTRPLVVVTAPGPGSGKMATCISQLYKDHELGIQSGYSKFETFPIWNLPLKHPVNVAYEAATVDLDDKNMVDIYHLENYGEVSINYNRDIEIYPVLHNILKKIYGESPYNSPTDMGVNQVGYCIDLETAAKAGRAEVLRRYFKISESVLRGTSSVEELERIERIILDLGISKEENCCYDYIQNKLNKENKKYDIAVLETTDGNLISGKNKGIFTEVASTILNTLKYLSDLSDDIHLIEPDSLSPLYKLKEKYLNESPKLDLSDILIALGVSANQNINAEKAFDSVYKLRGLRMHTNTLISKRELETLNKLGIDITSNAVFKSSRLYNI